MPRRPLTWPGASSTSSGQPCTDMHVSWPFTPFRTASDSHVRFSALRSLRLANRDKDFSPGGSLVLSRHLLPHVQSSQDPVEHSGRQISQCRSVGRNQNLVEDHRMILPWRKPFCPTVTP